MGTLRKNIALRAGFSGYAYAGLLLLSVVYLVGLKEPSNVAICLGIALAFDPFNQSIPFPERPLYQRIWLLIHLLLAIIAIIYSVIY